VRCWSASPAGDSLTPTPPPQAHSGPESRGSAWQMVLSAAEVEQFDDQGFVLIDGPFDEDWLDAAEAAHDRCRA